MQVKTEGIPSTLEPRWKTATHGIDSRLPVFDVRPPCGRVPRWRALSPSSSTLAGMFALIAGSCGAPWDYELWPLTQMRTHEIGVRMALAPRASTSCFETCAVAGIVAMVHCRMALGLAFAPGLTRFIARSPCTESGATTIPSSPSFLRRHALRSAMSLLHSYFRYIERCANPVTAIREL